ncbi:hypothetical protein ACWDO6_21175 [Streptomyces sp. NPDC003674]
MLHPLPATLGPGLKEPLNAGGITAHACDTALRMMDAFGHEKVYGQDMEAELSQEERDAKVLALLGQRYIPPGIHTQDAYWEAQARTHERRLVHSVRNTLTSLDNESGRPLTVLGDEGTLAEREEEFRALVKAEQPAVSVAFTGSLRRWLSASDATATSIAITAYLPDRPLYAALVTPKTALLSDCSGSYRLSLDDGWLAMTGEPTVAEPDPNCVVLPHSMMDQASGIRRHYSDPFFPYDTSSAIAQAVLGGAVPGAVHLREPVLNSAIIPVAVGHGMIVRFLDSGKVLKEPWDASRHLYKAVTGEIAFGDFVVARNRWDAHRISRILRNDADDLDPLDPLAPYDDFDFDFSDEEDF